MRECLEKHPCMSSTFPIAILYGTSCFQQQLQVYNENSVRYGRNTDALVNMNTKPNVMHLIKISNVSNLLFVTTRLLNFL